MRPIRSSGPKALEDELGEAKQLARLLGRPLGRRQQPAGILGAEREAAGQNGFDRGALRRLEPVIHPRGFDQQGCHGELEIIGAAFRRSTAKQAEDTIKHDGPCGIISVGAQAIPDKQSRTGNPNRQSRRGAEKTRSILVADQRNPILRRIPRRHGPLGRDLDIKLAGFGSRTPSHHRGPRP